MRIGYIILSHRDLPQIVKHVRTITTLDPSATILISHDLRDRSAPGELAELPDVILQMQAGARGDFGGIERWLRAAEALRNQMVDYVVLLSGQDHLVTHPDRIKAELAESPDGYMEHFDVLDEAATPWGVSEGRGRYFYRWRKTVALSDAWSRRLHFLHGINYVQPWVRANVAYGNLRVGRISSGPPSPYLVYGGSQWNSLSWRAVDRVLTVARERNGLVEWGRTSLVSDESFIQTIVLNQDDLVIGQGSKRYYDFTDGQFGHPKVLGLDDLPAIEASGAWFARKFDWVRSRDLARAIDVRLGVGGKQ